MNTFITKIAILIGIFCTTQMYAQFDFSPSIDYTTSPEKLKNFIQDSIEEHEKTIINIGTPYKYCLPHVCSNRVGKSALVGFDHQPITAFEYDYFTGGWHDNAYIVSKDKLQGCIDNTGKFIVPIKYPQLYFSNPGNLIITGKNGFIFDRKGQAILPEGFKYLGTLNLGQKTVIKAKQESDDFLSIFDLDGKIITTCAGFNIESINIVNNDRYVVEVSSDFYTHRKVVDSNLVEIVPPIFQYVDWVSNKWVSGKESNPNKGGLYSINEKKHYPLPYKFVYMPMKDQSGFIVGTKSLEFGIIDENLKEVLPCRFSSIEQLIDKDIFIIRTFSNNAGLVDGQGNIILDTIYSNIWPVIIPVPIDRDKIRSNPTIFPGSKPLPTEFLRLADHEGQSLSYQLDKKIFLNGDIEIVTPDLFRQRLDNGSVRLMHRNGKLISPVYNIWTTPTLKVVVQKEANSTQVQIYDRSGNLLKQLDNMPKSVEIPYRDFYAWTDSNSKVGILDSNFNTIVKPQFDAIYALGAMPEKFVSIWVKYAFRNLEHSFLGWVWDQNKDIPLLNHENGTLVSITDLE